MMRQLLKGRLIPGQKIDVFKDWQTERVIEGVVTLIKFQRDVPSYAKGHAIYAGERWLVEFYNFGITFRTHRIIRVIP